MDRPVTNPKKDSTTENSSTQYAIVSREPKRESLVSKSSRRKLTPSKTLMLDVLRSRGLYLRNINGLQNNIPKYITTFDEKYIRRCLESIHNCAFKRSAEGNLTSRVDISPNNMGSNNMARVDIKYPLLGKTEVVMSSFCDWTAATLFGSQAMINILRSTLLQKSGFLDFESSIRKSYLLYMDQRIDSDFTDSKQELYSNSFIQKELKQVLDRKYLSEPVHKRDASTSSTSSFSDQSSSSSYGESFQGMLQSTWKDGVIRHVFSVDDKKEVYMAKLSMLESLGGKKGLDCIYTFYSASNGKKECNTHEHESESIAKMFVSTSINSNSNNFEIREIQFILSVSSDNLTGEMQKSNYSLKKNKKLTEKVVDVFKFAHSHKLRSNSKIGISSSTLEEAHLGPYEYMHDNHHSLSPNLELAAIVVKEVCKISNEAGLGGWGMKFLKKIPSLENLSSSVSTRDNEKCSTSINVVIPVGFHGGPRTGGSGPSGLVERWMSGGRCDCGGWDVGCPITVLRSMSNGTDFSFQVDDCGECKSVDLFMQGSKQNAPIMKLVNFLDGLYYVHFQPTLSSLQSFAIATAIIHSRSPAFRSQVYKK
ncbi:Protein of unknown function (DUF3527 [Striga hermonthica]|uniref:Uncharacterized protein n=1 Tax=Striga hermonthica TaxID=68872 RepID=A0A9N7R8P9_STRHE|nr:Protein of unknown function (DUF3527 [Striga hermonthica]